MHVLRLHAQTQNIANFGRKISKMPHNYIASVQHSEDVRMASSILNVFDLRAEHRLIFGANFKMFRSDADNGAGRSGLGRLDKVHGRFANESSDETMGGAFVNLAGRSDLLKTTFMKHCDPLPQSERVFVVVCDIEQR